MSSRYNCLTTHAHSLVHSALFAFITQQNESIRAESSIDGSRLRAEGEGELRLARQVLADEALALHLCDAEALVHLGQDHLHHELVARDDGPAELDAVDAC